MTEAWLRAKEIADRLPKNAQWSFCITDIEDDAVFNIYAAREVWHGLRVLLALPRAEFRYDGTRPGEPSYEEYTIDGLALSLITPEEQDERDEPAGPTAD